MDQNVQSPCYYFRYQFMPFFFEEMHAFSLIPRPFPPSVFDRLQYANMEGEDLGNLVTCSDVR